MAGHPNRTQSSAQATLGGGAEQRENADAMQGQCNPHNPLTQGLEGPAHSTAPAQMAGHESHSLQAAHQVWEALQLPVLTSAPGNFRQVGEQGERKHPLHAKEPHGNAIISGA